MTIGNGTGLPLVEELLGAAAAQTPRAGRRSLTLMGRFAGPGPHGLEPVNDLDVLAVYDPLDGPTLEALRAAFRRIEDRPRCADAAVTCRFVNGPVKLPPEEGRTLFLYHVSIYTPETLRAESPLLLKTWLRRHRTLAGSPLDALVPAPALQPRHVLEERLGVRWALDAIRTRRVPFASWSVAAGQAVCREDHLLLDEAQQAEMLCYAVLHAVENTLLAVAGGAADDAAPAPRVFAGPGAVRLLDTVAKAKDRLRDPGDAGAVDRVLALEPAVLDFLEGLADWLGERAGGP